MTNEYRDQKVGPLTILFGKDNGKYPHGNSLLISGLHVTGLVDPSLGVVARMPDIPSADMVLHSHVHEDHVAGSHLYADKPWYAHNEDLLGLESIEGMLDIYGFPGAVRQSFEQTLTEEFYYQPHEDSHGFDDGAVFNFGGVRLTVMHTPGHTRGHCCFIIDWGENFDDPDARLVYLGDIELTGFGPYYGDAWSDLEDFEASLTKVREIDARYWLTFHHKGLIESREAFLPMLDKFAGMIDYRERNLLAYLSEPRTLDEIVAHRFVYRPENEGDSIDAIERRSMGMHLARLVRDKRVQQRDLYFVVNS